MIEPRAGALLERAIQQADHPFGLQLQAHMVEIGKPFQFTMALIAVQQAHLALGKFLRIMPVQRLPVRGGKRTQGRAVNGGKPKVRRLAVGLF